MRYYSRKFIRTGGGVSFEERSAQPGDFTKERGFPYAAEYAASPSLFDVIYPDFNRFADGFVLRRAVISISGKQRVDTPELKAGELQNFLNPGFQDVRNFMIPGSDSSSIPSGEYQLTSLNFTDNGDGYTDITISYQQKKEWQLIQLETLTPPKRAEGY